MKFSDFFQQYIKEDAIENMDLMGDWGDDAPRRGYDKPSIGILKNENGVEKIKKLWSKFEYPTDIYLVRSAAGWKYTEVGEVDEDFIVDKLKINIPINHDNITIFFTNNKAAEKVPLTAWTLAHRLGHAMRRDGTGGGFRINHYYEYVNKTIDKLINDVGEKVYGHTTKRTFSYGGDGDAQQKEKIRIALIRALGTFKSARDKTLVRSGEFANELIAQFIITGKVTLNKKLPDILATRHNWGRPEGAYNRARSEALKEEVEDLISSAENDLHWQINDLCQYAVGRIYVM